jgi:hypothetical protein
MVWFRTNRGVVTWLALFALACQFSFSFGHVHLGKSLGGRAALTSVQTADAAGDAPSSPQKDAAPAADFCAICANISLLSTLILPILALILAPGLFIRVPQWPPAVRESVSFGHLPFNARGPPYADMPA